MCGGQKHEICRQSAYVVHRNAKIIKGNREKTATKYTKMAIVRAKRAKRSCRRCHRHGCLIKAP